MLLLAGWLKKWRSCDEYRIARLDPKCCSYLFQTQLDLHYHNLHFQLVLLYKKVFKKSIVYLLKTKQDEFRR